MLRWRQLRALQDVRPPLNVLCVGDVNLGDAVNLQVVADVFLQHFPDSGVDYVHSRTAAPLVEHNPGISRNFPLFTGRFIPTEEESREVRRVAEAGRYDLVLNLCPFLPPNVLSGIQSPVVNSLRLVTEILANLGESGAGDESAAMNANLVQYVEEIAGMIPSAGESPDDASTISPTIYLSVSSLMERDAWMSSAGVNSGERTVLYNPDASNRYTLINERIQIQILRRILKSDACDRVLMASGFTFEGIERRLVEKLPGPMRDKVTVIPRELPVDAYTALLDATDVFVSADTGPVHLAAVRKCCTSPERTFRNRTAICSVFGSTLPLVYGYDSECDRCSDPGQDAPARFFEGACPDKNITCSLARITGRCAQDACFAGVEARDVADYVLGVLTRRRNREWKGRP